MNSKLTSKPLTTWYCDFCDAPIKGVNCVEDINCGYVIWKQTAEGQCYSFKIIHHVKCDPEGDYCCSMPLNEFLGIDGLAYLLTFLSQKLLGASLKCRVFDIEEFVDFFRRIQIPFYEEARRKFENPNLKDLYLNENVPNPYFPDELKKISVSEDF